MPFKSKAQQRFLFANHPEMAKRWAAHTPDIKSLPEKVDDEGEDKEREKKAFAAHFILKAAAAGVTDPEQVARLAEACTEHLRRVKSAGINEVAGGAATGLGGLASSVLATGPILGSVVLPLGIGGGLGAVAAGARNQMDVDDADTMQTSAQVNAYRRMIEKQKMMAQVRKLMASDPSRYVVMG